MSTAKRARMNPLKITPERAKIVSDAMCFYAAWELAEFHHAGHLDSYEADEGVAYH